MKGLLYDPLLRRFITPDPFVTDPLNPQGMNRYAYVQNNPLMFTDPSGFDGTIPSQEAPEMRPEVRPPVVDTIRPTPNAFPNQMPGQFGPMIPTSQPNYMVNPSTPPPGGGADMASARAEAANQAGQMQQMGQLAGYEGNARVANSSPGNSTFSAPNPFAGDRVPGSCSTGGCLADNTGQGGTSSVASDAGPRLGYNGAPSTEGSSPQGTAQFSEAELWAYRIMALAPVMCLAPVANAAVADAALKYAASSSLAIRLLPVLIAGGPVVGAKGAPGLLKAATQAFKNGPLTAAGRALTKHPNIIGESGDILKKLGGAANVNAAAARAIENILSNGTMATKTTKAFGDVVQYTLESGLGARWSATTGEFIGFLGRGL